MKNYYLKKIISAMIIIFGVLMITFLLIYHLPGNPAEVLAGQRSDPETLARIQHEWGLDQPLLMQFWTYAKSILRFDLGESIYTRQKILESLCERFPLTFFLALAAVFISALVGLPIGILSAVSPNTFIDRLFLTLTLLGISMPIFWLGIIVLQLSSHLDSLSLVSNLSPFITNFFLAAVVLGIRPSALLARVTRTQMLSQLSQDYVMAARTRGLSAFKIYFRHAFRNCLGPVITVLALDFGSLLGGAAITETIFCLPGIGKLALTGIGRRDYPVIMGMVLFSSVVFVLVNLIVDLILPILNPRLREKQTR